MLSQDALLVAGVKAGDENAFTAIVERYQGMIGRYLLRLVGDLALAEDLCQETFFRAYWAIFKTDDDLALKPWLYRIATNVAYSALRRRRRTPLPLDCGEQEHSAKQPSFEQQAAQRDLVQRVLLQLSPDYAVPLVLSAVEGFGYHEIAEILLKGFWADYRAAMRWCRLTPKPIASNRSIPDTTTPPWCCCPNPNTPPAGCRV